MFETRFKNCPPDQTPYEPTPVKHSGTPGRMPQGLQRMPPSQGMNRSFQPKQQQQPAASVGPSSHEGMKQEVKQETVEENSESEIDRDERLENWNRRLLQVSN